MHLFAVNQVGHEAGFSGLNPALDLPWVQDTPEVNAWGAWSVTYRDVVVLGPENERVGVYNLTEHDLADPSNRTTLKDMLRKAAQNAAATP